MFALFDISHDMVVGFSKSYGLVYLVLLSLGVGVYACWPANERKFDRAARSILNDEDGPCT